MERAEPFVDLAKFDHGYADLETESIAKRWSAYYINNGFLQESLALTPISVIILQKPIRKLLTIVSRN
jgi:hypothetical protein